MTTLQAVELGVLGPLQVRQGGAPVAVPGAKPRAILTMLGLHGGSVVSADTLVELLWGEDPPRTAAKALQTHISSLRRALGDGFVLTAGAGWTLAESDVDASRYKSAARLGRDAAAAGDISQAVAHFEEALALWRGIPELPDGRRGTSEKTRWIEGHAALVEDRLDALLATGRAAEVVGDLEAAVADAPLRERRWGQLMLALYRAGRQGEALGAYQRARSLLADELGVDPGPELRRLEAAIVAQDASLDIPVAQNLAAVTRAVTFFLTDIEGSTAAWEADAAAMGVALARHDELVEQVVTSRGGRLIKTRGEGDATFSVFERPSAAVAAAIELQDAIVHEPWALREPMRVRVALHTGEAELRDGDYFGRAVNRAARLRSLAEGGQILCSGATAELVIDSLSDDVVLNDLGMRQLRNLVRPEHVFELRLETADEHRQAVPPDEPIARPSLPAVLAGPGPFVGRESELGQLFSAWQTTLAGATNAALIAGEPGVGKTRLAGEWSRQAYDQGALVIYGRCDEDLGAAYQPFAEALRSLVPCLGSSGLRGLRGVEALLALVPGLTDVLPDLSAPTRADPDTERYALFDAVVALLGVASASAPVVLILDDLHWAAKPTLLLLRHLLRFGDQARVQIIGTYRSTDLDRSHPLAAMLADLHRDGTANRIQLSGLDEKDVTAYVAEAGYDDEELARALASVTGGNPFFLIEALRHVDESGGHWDPSTLPQGVREAVSRRLSRLPVETNKALAAAAVVGSRFALDLVERVVGEDLVDAFDEAAKAGIIIEEPGGHYRFNHAIVRQSLLAELASVRRMRLHQRIATTLENAHGADDELLAELAYHYFECAWAGNAAKAVDYCRRAADQAMTRLGYEGAADLYDRALHALEEIDDELPDRNDQASELLVARCEALLAAGDVASAAGAVSQLQQATVDSARLSAWATCFDGELSILVHPERLDDVEAALGAAAHRLAEIDDAAGEAKAHTVRARCLARLGRVGDCEIALDDALTAARRARDHRRVNAVLAGAPLAALWGPNPVPRAGGRCLDVVRLLRITTDSPAVEATSTRCQAVLEAFRGREAAARRMIDSARRTVTELGLRHSLLEVEQFAGIVELVLDDPAAAEPHLRQAYNGFRRMGLDADTAETAALLGRACLALDRDAEANELCTESERLAGHALKPSIAWRAVRAQLLSRGNNHEEARRVAQAAITLAERTDALVDHGDACLALATVLGAAGDAAGARAAAERAASLYERKGAAALAEKARHVVGQRAVPTVPVPPEPPPVVELDNACTRAGKRLVAAVNRGALDEYEQLHAPTVFSESHRKALGFTHAAVAIVPPENWAHEVRRVLGTSGVRLTAHDIAVRGERLALARLVVGTADASPGAPQDEFLQIYGIDEQGRISLQIFFDLEDMDAAIAELDAAHARFEEETHRQVRRLDNAASQAAERYMAHFAARDWDELAKVLADNISVDDRRRVVNAGIKHGRDAEIANLRAAADVGITYFTSVVIAARGERLILAHVSGGEGVSGEFLNEVLGVIEINSRNEIAAIVVLDLDDFDDAIAELDARYLAGEAATHARTWSVITGTYASVSRQELPALTPDCMTIDHRRVTAFAPGEMTAYIRAGWEIDQTIRTYVEVVHRLSDLGAVCTYAAHGVSREGFDGEWRGVNLGTVNGDMVNRCELFDETDLGTALARFDQLSRPAPRLENAASRLCERYLAHFAARDWDALAKVLADDISIDDRRRVVNAGIRHGRDAEIANLRATADAGFTYMTSVVVAARGERLILARASGRDRGSEEFLSDAWGVVEINSHNQIAAIVVFDLDDFHDAIADLDARYLAGEAAAHAQTWSVITGGHAAVNRHELPPMTPDCVSIDHRRGTAFAPGELSAYFRAGWDLDQDIQTYVEVVHRLTNLGAVCTHVGHGVSHQGFDAEWRGVDLLTVDGDMVNRCVVFDEAHLDAAIARFDQLGRPAPQLENAASRVDKRFAAYFAARDWDAMAELTADGICIDDRRHVVNAGLRRGRDAEIANLRARAETGMESITSAVIAVRGERLALTRTRFWGHDQRPEDFHTEALCIIEIDTNERIVARVGFDLDDFEAAIAELDARYVAGEAAAHAPTWALVAQAFAAINRHELPELTPDWVNIDHRRGAAFAPGDMTAFVHDLFEDAPDINVYVEAVHRLSDLGVVVTQRAHGTSQEGFEAEWREIGIFMFEGDLLSRCELFDEADLDAALARFDQLSRHAPRLENAATRVFERLYSYVAARDWDAVAQITAENVSVDDRRRVVNAGILHGRDANIKDAQATVDVGFTMTMLGAMATRGERLALTGVRVSGRDPEAIQNDALNIVEIDAEERIVADVVFDLDDFDAAIAELDARYIAGEAAAYAGTWSVITGAFVALNRRELPATTPDPVSIDHRRVASFAPGEGFEYIHAGWDLDQNLNLYIETAHRVNDLGAVFTWTGYGTSHEGFEAEWRGVQILTVDGEMLNRSEVFDEADLDDALTRFDQLSQPAPRLENAVSRLVEQFLAHFAGRDWDALAELVADDMSSDDRRRVINAGIRLGRDGEMANWRATSDVWTNVNATVVATRGERLALFRFATSQDQPTDGFQGAALSVIEINDDNRAVASVVFELDDFDAAIAELDARYLAGEAAAHAGTWSQIAGVFVAHNRRELPATTPDAVSIDHRRGAAFAPGDPFEYISAGWDLDQNLNIYIEAAHRINDLGAVFTWAGHGTSHEGFDAEWRGVTLMTVDGEMVSRMEVFDEGDLNAALAKFDQRGRPTPRLENAASQAIERFQTCFAARDWDAMAEMMAEDALDEDRRRVVNAGVRRGRDAAIANMQAVAEIGAEKLSSTVIATRGDRLFLRRQHVGNEEPTEAFQFDDVLQIVEIDANQRLAAVVTFDLDNIDAAIAELDARYLAGEAAAHLQTWSVIAAGYAALNRHEVPPSAPDYVNIDHRLRATFEAGDLGENLRTAWDLTPDLKGYIEAVHRLTDLGAVVTYAAHGTSQEGLDAEWRTVHLLILEAGMVNRCEVFDEADLDAALTRFEQLSLPALRLKDSVAERISAHIVARDWHALAQDFADDYCLDDRRRVVNAGVMHGRDAGVDNTRVAAEVGLLTNITSTIIASRGERLTLERFHASGPDHESIQNDALNIVEIDADERVAAVVMFDLDDTDAAFAELDGRYLAGEAASHAQTWSVISQAYAALNRRELPATTQDWTSVDHRRFGTIESNALTPNIRAFWDITSDARVDVATVHELTNLGAVVAHATHATSREGVEIESGEIVILMVDGDLLSRCEIFDEADLDAALARFEELRPQTRRLENAATQVYERLHAYFVIRDWAAITEILGDGYYQDDDRPVVGGGIRRGRNALIQDLQAAADLGVADATSNVIAIRGERLALTRVRYSRRDEGPEPFHAEFLQIVEIDADARIAVLAALELDHVDTAFEQLDARYLAGEAAAHAHTWSVVSGAYAAMNRHELPATTPDWVNVDHRRGIAFAPGDASEYLRAWVDSRGGVYVETVHRLSNLGAVFTWAGRGTSQQGFEAEWRGINVLTVEGDRINRGEIFDEADLDAALARFDELQTQARRLENAATQLTERFLAQFAAGDWDAMPKMMADNFSSDDRRRVVGAGVRHGRNAQIMDMRVIADLGITHSNTTHLATRGKRLALSRTRMSGKDQPFYGEMLDVLEINADTQIVKYVLFDLDDVDAAFAELDARYLAGEAADHAHTWALVAGLFAGFNRHELAQTTPDFVAVDHRRLVAFAPGDIREFARTAFDQVPDLSFHVEAVHRLSNLGAVVTQALRGTSREGFEAEWCEIHLVMIEGDLFNRSEIFDEADLDAALARFDELHPQTRPLENAATRADDRFFAYFAARNWAALGEILTDESFIDDRRPVVNAGLWDGRDAVIANLQAVADAAANVTSVIATRGERLALTRIRSSNRDPRQGDFGVEMLNIVEIDTDERIVAHVEYDADDIDAAFEELEARYLVGEAGAHAQIWSVIARECAAFNQHDLPAADWVTIDHRSLVTIDASDLVANIRATWDLMPNISIRIEAVHRLSGFGAVVTYTAHGTTREGFDAEWRMIHLLTVEGDRISRSELFEEADLDAALARFDELHPQARRLENAASQVEQRFLTYFAARDWDAYAEILSDDVCTDDRRHVVNAGVRHGRDAEIASQRAVADVGVTHFTSTVIAIRGGRLALGCYSVFDGWSRSKVLCVSEINAENQIVARVAFDSDEVDAAFAELDARYLAGEAAAHADTWSVMMQACAAINTREIFATTADFVDIDHRSLAAIGSGDLKAYIRAALNDGVYNIYIEAVHRLGDLGAVVTLVSSGTSQGGFDGEWRMTDVFTVEGDLISRCEIFNEADLDAALARFEELQPQTRRLENAAARADNRFFAHTRDRNWAAAAEILADNSFVDDRRRVVNIGVWDGRDVVINNLRALADAVANVTLNVLAIRGERLALFRINAPNGGLQQGDFGVEMLGIVELDTDERIAAHVLFGPDDIDAAFAELDARYLAGEAAAHAHTWSVNSGLYAGFNRHELPATTPDWTYIDHRPLVTIEANDLPASMRAIWDLAPDISIYMEAVHRLSDLGAVVTAAAYGSSQEGFDAEWRMIDLFTVEGDLISRCEIFDEADLDAALARFDELHTRAPRLENAATQLGERQLAYFAARDWAAMAELVADDISTDDRRRVVNAGNQLGRDVDVANMRALADLGVAHIASTVIATRGERLALVRARMSGRDQRPDAFYTEALSILEIDADNRGAAKVVFDPDDVDAAFEELDARYVAGEAAAHAHTWSVISGSYAAFNRHEHFQAASDWVNIDRRRLSIIEEGDLTATVQAAWDLTPDISTCIAAVHRLTNLGAVLTQATHGTSQEGFDAEWRLIQLLTVDGDLVKHGELFDETDLDAALARFEELDRPPSP